MALPPMDPGREKNVFTAVKYVFETFGIPYNEETCEQMLVFLEAIHIYAERTEQYGELWKEIGAKANFYNGARKAHRARRMSEKDNVLESTLINDALDACNYLGFGIRNARLLNFEEKDGDG